jgi:hypothetical protein
MRRMTQNKMFQSDTGRDHDRMPPTPPKKRKSPDEDNRLETYHMSTRTKHKQCNNQKGITPRHTSRTLQSVTNTKFVFSFKCSYSKSKFTVLHSKLFSNIHGFTFAKNLKNMGCASVTSNHTHNYQQAGHFVVVFLYLLCENTQLFNISLSSDTSMIKQGI